MKRLETIAHTQNANKSRTKRFLLSSSNNYFNTGLFPFGDAHHNCALGSFSLALSLFCSASQTEIYIDARLITSFLFCWIAFDFRTKNIAWESNVMKIKTCPISYPVLSFSLVRLIRLLIIIYGRIGIELSKILRKLIAQPLRQNSVIASSSIVYTDIPSSIGVRIKRINRNNNYNSEK